MNDLVERLRDNKLSPFSNLDGLSRLMREAADEIERLEGLKSVQHCKKLAARIAELEAEVERLTAKAQRLYSDWKIATANDFQKGERIAELEAEIAQMKSFNHDAESCCCRFEEDGETPRVECLIHSTLRKRVAELEAEIEQLKERLGKLGKWGG